MTKMAAMPTYGKNLKKSSRNQKADDLKLSMQHRVLKYYQVCSNDDTGLTLTYFTAKKGKAMDVSGTIVVYDIKVGRNS